MWYYSIGKRYGNFKPQKIHTDWFQYGNFISLGNLIYKPLDKLNDDDFNEILNGFDRLMPIYEYCVLNIAPERKNEKRISRICWNDNDWVTPSGTFGKSTDKKSFERQHGFGYEEWLFDFEKLIDGYHYASLQSVHRGQSGFLNNIFAVRLYSHNSVEKATYWIGNILDLEVISPELSIEIYKQYNDNGWLSEMQMDVKSVKGDLKHLKQINPSEFFNVRFKPELARISKPYSIISNFKNIIGTHRYQFIHDFIKDSKLIAETKHRNFKFKSGKSDKSLEKRTSRRLSKEIQIEPLHDKIQEILYNHLVSIYGKEKVGMENPTGSSTRIDLTLSTDKGISIYEVKTYSAVVSTIRSALGQLFEYAYYPNPINNLNELIIVSHLPIGLTDKEYLELLRKKTSIKIYYQFVNPITGAVSEKI